MLNNKVILVTGGTGSFGKKYVEFILKNYKPKKVIIYSRDEFKQLEMKHDGSFKNNSKLRFFIGDVRDYERLLFALKEVDVVIHAAALKQVPATEYNPFEAVKTNILGSQNIINASLNNNVKKVLALSTDKAAAPVNLYGATKLTADKLFISSNNYFGKKNFSASVVRYGNVMGSRGSIIPMLMNEKNKTVNITDKKMTRFNITLEEGVKFVDFCLKKMIGGEIFVPKIPSYDVMTLVKAIAPKKKIKFIGVRPGEKIHEEMITNSDSLNTIDCRSYYIILPQSDLMLKKNKQIKKKKNGKFLKKEIY